MNRKRYYNICFGILLLLAAGCFHSCQQEDFEETTPGALLSRGRYLGARNGDSATALEKNDTTQFPVNTPYRLLAFTKPYYSVNDETAAQYPRFNKVAWEGATADNLHYINLADANRWFGFAAFDGEPAGQDNLVSLDFYGFTYGKAEEHSPGYIELDDLFELDDLSGEKNPPQGSLATLKRTEHVSEDLTTLNDLLYSRLLNRNIGNAGLTAATATQSIMYFRHCFSQLVFCVAQQYKEETDENGKPVVVPCFPGLQVEDVTVTNTYGEGAVYLEDGKVELSENSKTDRPLQFSDEYREKYDGAVTTEEVEMGRMIVFPSDGSALKNADKADGYSVGLAITVKSPNRKHIEDFIAQSDKTDAGITEVDGTTLYRGTIVLNSILDYYPVTGPSDLHFKQHTRYRLVLLFSKESVRIITVIPQVEEWLPGEGTEDDPWQDQAMGQPQMFDNIVWSDRNLGADHFDPTGADFEKTIGYFYQSGRNIPYFPFNTMDYYTDETKVENGVTYYKMNTFPSPDKKRDRKLAESGSYDNTTHRFYPMVDDDLLNMKRKEWGQKGEGSNSEERIWTLDSWGEKAQMDIPETKPTDSYFDFKRANFQPSEDMHWEDPVKGRQPVRGDWVVPSSKDFMKIFPTTPDAGNIAFRKGDDNNSPISGWCTNEESVADTYSTLRVTVPFYTSDMADWTDEQMNNDDRLKGRSENYKKAWKLLRDSSDAGTTHLEVYNDNDAGGGGPARWSNRDLEPDGDPEDGYASVYVISRDGDDKQSVPDVNNGLYAYKIKSWGTIYAIKRVYTAQAYRMRWQVLCAETYGTTENPAPAFYVKICRYRCKPDDRLTEQNYKTDYDWEHPAATLYFPICGLGDNVGTYINFGTECQYATSDKIESDGRTGAVHLKVTGDDDSNAFIAVLQKTVDRKFCKQIRPVRGGY